MSCGAASAEMASGIGHPSDSNVHARVSDHVAVDLRQHLLSLEDLGRELDHIDPLEFTMARSGLQGEVSSSSCLEGRRVGL